jgi:hypothetical protein
MQLLKAGMKLKRRTEDVAPNGQQYSQRDIALQHNKPPHCKK